MSSEVKLVILISTQAGQEQEQIDAFEKLAPLVRNEYGCLQYDPHRVSDDENQFVLTERWASALQSCCRHGCEMGLKRS